MMWTITYSVDVNGDEHSGTVEAENHTMNPTVARQIAAMELFNDRGVAAVNVDVNEIAVSWEEA